MGWPLFFDIRSLVFAVNNCDFSTRKFDSSRVRVSSPNSKSKNEFEFESIYTWNSSRVEYVQEKARKLNSYMIILSLNWFKAGHTQKFEFQTRNSRVLDSNSNRIDSKILEIFELFRSFFILIRVMHLLTLQFTI